MKVFKFGGASVKSAEGVRNLRRIAGGESGELFIIISAMGKTTNALETVTDHFIKGEREAASAAFSLLTGYHENICRELFDGRCPAAVAALFSEVADILENAEPSCSEFEKWYDRIVSYGEMLSTAIVSEYLNLDGVENRLLDMRRLFVTDRRHRDANIDMDVSSVLLKAEIADSPFKVFVGQGFIGGTPEGKPTTLGREGSDYSAAVAAYILDAESVTIWKDVEGILSADPKIFSDTVLIPELTYLDAIELAYSGAQIIHPKTIKPLQNKNIPLYVRPFGDPSKRGSVIKAETDIKADTPILILKRNQILVSIRPNDFSFVLEDRFAGIFSLLEKYNLKINLIQSSAVNLSICIDRSRYLETVMEELKRERYRVVYNDGMELLTIRGYTRELYEKYGDRQDVFLLQKTRRILRVLRREEGTPENRA